MSKSARKWIFLAVVVAAIAAAYTLGGFFGVPRLVKSQVLGFVSENYGRKATLGEVRFNPFTFVLEARDFSMPDKDGQRMLAFGRLLVDLDVATAWRRAPSFTVIKLDQPFVRTLVRPDKSVNLAELAKPFASDPDEEMTRLFLDRFVVSGGTVTFEDRSHASPFRARLQPVSFDLRDFSTTEKTGNAYALRGASASGERFSWDGTVALEPLGSRGRFQVAELETKTIGSYLRDSLDFDFSGGKIGLNGDYDFSAADAVKLIVNVQQVSVAGLGIRPRGGELDYIQDARVEVGNVRLDLASERVDVGTVKLADATIRAWRDANGAINLNELMPAESTKPAEPAEPVAPSSSASAKPESKSQPESGWVVAAPDIAVENLRLDVEDRFVKPVARFVLAPVSAQVKGYSTAPGTVLDADAKIRLNESADISGRAQLSLDAGTVSAHVDVKSFDLASLQPYLNTYTQVSLRSGLLTTGLDVEWGAKGVLTVKGDTEVAKLHVIDNTLRQDMLKWDHVRVAGLEYVSEPARLNISNIAARAPYARVIIAPDQTLNLTKAFSPAPGSAPPAAVQTVQTSAGETKAPAGNPGETKISVGTIRVTNGSANFSDFWIQPNYAVSLQSMNGTIAGLSSDPRSRAKVKLEGKVDRYAPANIEGEINLLSAALFTDMKVSFKGVEMTSVTPYSGRFAGYKIEKGKLSIDVAYRIENRALSAKQKFVIDQLQLGEKVESPDAVRLPMRLAVALLKDRNGVIDLDLPISGSLDDPKFRIGPIVWKAIVNLLTKVATAPFALLGGLFGGGEEMNLIEFAPGESTLDPAAQERIASMVKALQERPQLQVEIPVAWSPEVDAEPLASRKVDEKIESLATEQNDANGEPKRRGRDAEGSDGGAVNGNTGARVGDAAGPKNTGARVADAVGPKNTGARVADAVGPKNTGARVADAVGPKNDGAQAGGAPAAKNAGAQTAGGASDAADDPAQRFDLLLAQYRADNGAEAQPPPATAALLALPKRKRDPASFTAANDELEQAIREKQPVSEADFQQLAEARAHAIQDALLGTGEIDTTRVFLLAASPTQPKDGKVQLALSLK